MMLPPPHEYPLPPRRADTGSVTGYLTMTRQQKNDLNRREAAKADVSAFALPAGKTISDVLLVAFSSIAAYHHTSPWREGFTLCGAAIKTSVPITDQKLCNWCKKKFEKILLANETKN